MRDSAEHQEYHFPVQPEHQGSDRQEYREQLQEFHLHFQDGSLLLRHHELLQQHQAFRIQEEHVQADLQDSRE